MDNPEKPASYDTEDEDKKNQTQYLLNTTTKNSKRKDTS
jgi:hypothetical protein